MKLKGTVRVVITDEETGEIVVDDTYENTWCDKNTHTIQWMAAYLFTTTVMPFNEKLGVANLGNGNVPESRTDQGLQGIQRGGAGSPQFIYWGGTYIQYVFAWPTGPNITGIYEAVTNSISPIRYFNRVWFNGTSYSKGPAQSLQLYWTITVDGL